ncbi:dicarboxylate/amino acid:cation symporter [bacterium DOLZORAL124_64_63]|nr:MAG: dicarboxylate/amino acid:cation symporter [bacterium DOLZORAL124_64_63]
MPATASAASAHHDSGSNLTVKVLAGLGLGIVVGLVINLSGPHESGGVLNTWLVEGLFRVVGRMFVNALKMLVVPLVLFSLVSGVCGIGNLRQLGRVGGKSFALYILTTAVAIASALLVAGVVAPGTGMEVSTAETFRGSQAPPLSQVLIDIVPGNPVKALADGAMLQVIFFAILLGVSILMAGDKAAGVAEGMEKMNAVMMKMVDIVMAAAPYAVFCLIAYSVAGLGLKLLVQLLSYVLVLIGVLFLHLFVTLMLVLKIFSGLSPVMFLRKMRGVQAFAFSTASSNATIPVTLRAVTRRLGVGNAVAAFTIPFGATINMDGTAIMQGVATVFIANVYDVPLGLGDYLTVILMAVLASIGTAGVPGVGLVMLSMVFKQVGLPVEGIGLILGVDRLLDMVRTAVNVCGDAAVTCIVAKGEGPFDQAVFDDPDAGISLDS